MLISIFDLMGAQTDRLRCEVYQNLILSPMNTGLLRHAVATAPTVYGIETSMQNFSALRLLVVVATAPTVYGIETSSISSLSFFAAIRLQQHLPFTVLKPTERLLRLSKIFKSLQQHLPFTVLKRIMHGITQTKRNN